jgi:CheY-like chemotaxis protein
MEDTMKAIATDCATPKRILYIGNHEDSREMLVLMLEDTGYTMSTATSITEGLSLAKFEHFNLFILDSRFKDGNGVDLCPQIRAFDPLTPIIFYSSSAYPWDIAAGLAAGAQQYLIKPIGIYTSSQIIARLLTDATNAQATMQREYSPN